MALRKNIFKALNVEPSEQTAVTALLLQSFFLGVFYGSFDIGAHTLFLHVFDSSAISKAYAVSGIVGIVMTALYSRLQSIIRFSTLAVINLGALSLIAVALRLGFNYTDDETTFAIAGMQFTPLKLLVFMVFVMLGPLNILAIVGFWGVVGRLFNLRQGKRLFGMIGSGQVIGVIVTSLAVPVIPLIIKTEFPSKNLLLISAGSIVLALFIQVFLARRFNLNGTDTERAEKRETVSLLTHLKNPYIRYMAIFIALSMITAFFGAFSFLGVTKINYPEEKDMASFLGGFSASVNILGLIIKTFLFSKLMKNYGLKVGLLILPVLLILITLVASIQGSFVDFEQRPVSMGFMFFFILMSLTRLFSMSLRDAIEQPAFKTLYQSLNSSIRYDVQAKIDGTVNEIAAVASGLVLLILSALSFVELLHFSYILFAILGIWIFVILRLNKEYKIALSNSLAKSDDNNNQNQQNTTKTMLRASEIPHQKFAYNMQIAASLDPEWYSEQLHTAVISPHPDVRKFAIHNISNANPLMAMNNINQCIEAEDNETIKQEATRIRDNYTYKLQHNASIEKVSLLVRSRLSEDRVLAAKIIGYMQNDAYAIYLPVLLRDISPDVIHAAILAANVYPKPELSTLLCEYLSTRHRNLAAQVLQKIGTPALDSLENIFYKAGTNTNMMLQILKIYAQIGGEKAIAYSINKLTINNRRVLRQALETLFACHYKVKQDKFRVFQRLIEQNSHITGWNLAALETVNQQHFGLYLREALREEIKDNYDTLYLILSLIYDPQSVQQVRSNLESGTNEGIGYALELLDLFIDEELKPILFPLLDDMPVVERIRLLQNHFPIEVKNLDILLTEIINRDSNYIGRWTKAVAMYCFRDIDDFFITDSIVAQLFNSDMLIAENTASLMYETNMQKYRECSQRLPIKQRNKIDYTVNLLQQRSSHLIFEKTLFLKRTHLLDSLSSYSLIAMAEQMEEVNLKAEQPLWNDVHQDHIPLFFIIIGNVVLNNNDHTIRTFAENDMIWDTDTIYNNAKTKIITQTEVALYKIERDNLNQLMSDYDDIAQIFIQYQ